VRAWVVPLLWCVLRVPVAEAQVRAPSDGGLASAIGQPGPWKWTLGAASGWARRRGENQGTTEGRLGVYRDIGNPVVGLAAVHLEGWAGSRDASFDGGVRARLVSPLARLGVGAEYNAADGRTRAILSLVHPGRRGGLFRDGSLLRVDVAPGRSPSVTLGIETPAWRRIPAGTTRPAENRVRATGPVPARSTAALSPRAQDAIDEARQAAAWIARLTVPALEHRSTDRRVAEREVRRHIEAIRLDLAATMADGSAEARSMNGEVRRLHTSVARAIAYALDPAGERGDTTDRAVKVSRHVREVLLDEVLLPWNRLLGQAKDDGVSSDLAGRSRGTLLRWLHVESGVNTALVPAVMAVYDALLDIVEYNRMEMQRAWRDSRFVWLPLQYALLPEDHDTQAELDAIVERAVGARFTDGNFVSYVINEQFQYQLARTIREAREYHVLWTHDFRGYDDQGNPDEMSFRHVVRSYLAALTARVREYDRTGRMPTYFILLDEWFYEVNKGRLWMNVLEDPTRARAGLPDNYPGWRDTLEAAQGRLRAAIAGSRLLQEQRAQYGDEWLRRLVRVQVNITNASDPTFWSWNLVRGVPMLDNTMRDHRKLVFYDITEEDPYRGEAMYTGAGVGEHYANLSWEDRSLLVRGPAALSLKRAAREMLESQGMTGDRLPHALRPRPLAPDYAVKVKGMMEGAPRSLRALDLHNATGFGRKDVNVAKAVLYTLMPAGSVIKIPDSLWNGTFWGAALAGCALRGVRVLVIAPSYANAPARAFGSLQRGYELLWRLATVSRELDAEITAAGGLLKVGIYSSDLAVTDIPGKVRAVRRTFAQHAWLRQLFAFPNAVYDDLAQLAVQLNGLEMGAGGRNEFESEDRPRLHLKANLFASREAWQLMSRPEWPEMTWEFIQQRIAQVQSRSAAVANFEAYPDAFLDVGSSTVQSWYEGLAPEVRGRAVFYTLMGSHNQNTRSMVIDGEDAFMISGWPAIIPYLDLISLVGQSTWLDDPAALNALLPPQSRMRTRLAHWFRVEF
jgi:hypothetical protein